MTHVAIVSTLIGAIILVSPVHMVGQEIGASPIYYSGGNVGIGTASPGALLDIYSNSTNSTYMNLTNTNGHIWTLYSSGGGPSPTGSFGVYDSTAGVARLVVGASGNVGIGTTNPASTLDVSGYLHVTGVGFNPGAAAQGAYLSWNGLTGGTGEADFINNAANAPGGFAFINTHAGGASPATLMFITGSGNVGIGTIAPQYPLSVNGIVQAKEVLVNTGWSDYVFEAGYRLAPLAEVSAYVQKHHHLPEIPSASEVAEKGISVGEIQAKLLAKIEELTLHMIHTDQENQELKERLQRLEHKDACPAGATVRHCKPGVYSK